MSDNPITYSNRNSAGCAFGISAGPVNRHLSRENDVHPHIVCCARTKLKCFSFLVTDTGEYMCYTERHKIDTRAQEWRGRFHVANPRSFVRAIAVYTRCCVAARIFRKLQHLRDIVCASCTRALYRVYTQSSWTFHARDRSRTMHDEYTRQRREPD